MSPVGWKPGARQQFNAGKTRICSSRTVAGQFQLKSGMHPFGWKPRVNQQFSAGRATLRSSRTVAGHCQIRSGMHPFGRKPWARQQFQCRPSNSLQWQNISSQKTTIQTEPREIGGSAQGLLSTGCAVACCMAYQEQKKQHSDIKENNTRKNRPRTTRKRTHPLSLC